MNINFSIITWDVYEDIKSVSVEDDFDWEFWKEYSKEKFHKDCSGLIIVNNKEYLFTNYLSMMDWIGEFIHCEEYFIDSIHEGMLDIEIKFN